jgi:putative intracellular protease/amidase
MDRLTRVLIAVGAIILLILIAVLILFDKDPTAYVGSIAAVIAALAAAGLVGRRVGDVNTKVDAVARNVNGNTTRLLDALEYYQARDREAVRTGEASATADPPISEDTILRIRQHNDTLPKHE